MKAWFSTLLAVGAPTPSRADASPPPGPPEGRPARGTPRPPLQRLLQLFYLIFALTLLLGALGTKWYTVDADISEGSGYSSTSVQVHVDHSLGGVTSTASTDVTGVGHVSVTETKSWGEYADDYKKATGKDPKLPGVYMTAQALLALGVLSIALAIVIEVVNLLGRSLPRRVPSIWLFVLVGGLMGLAAVSAFTAMHPGAYAGDSGSSGKGPQESFMGSDQHQFEGAPVQSSVRSSWGPGVGWVLALIGGVGMFAMGLALLYRLKVLARRPADAVSEAAAAPLPSPVESGVPVPAAPGPGQAEPAPSGSAPARDRPSPPSEPAPPGEPGPSFFRKLLANRVLLVGLVLALVVAVAGAAALSGGGGGLLGGKKPGPSQTRLQELAGSSAVPSALVPEGQSLEFPIVFATGGEGNVTNIHEVAVSVTWTDAMTQSRPDGMTFTLASPDGQHATQSTEGMSGSARLTLAMNVSSTKVEDNSMGWTLTARCDYAGDDPVGPIGFLVYVDPGNDFSATADFKYYGKG